MKNRSHTLILLLGLSAAATALHAMEPYIFEEIDTDHNGAISMEEAKVRADLSTDFATADKDGDGTLSVDEYSAYMNKGKMAPEDMEIPEPGAAPVY